MKILIALMFLTLISLSVISLASENIGIVIHGGAGTIKKENLTDEKSTAINTTLSNAAEAGYQALEKKGKPSLETVQIAINIIEDSPIFTQD